MNDLLAVYGLKFHPFRPDVPIEALLPTPEVDSFCRRVELSLANGGFAMVTGDPGTGKSVALRLLSHRLDQKRDVTVGSIDHPQSRVSDLYRQLGDVFRISMPHHNRWGGFKILRQCWADHITSTLARPILIIDEAQEMLTNAFNELRILSSERFDSRALLCIVFAGDQRLSDRLRHPDLLPLGSRIRRRLHLHYAERDLLTACLDHLLETAGNPTLMTTELKATLAEHAAGNFRILMNLADELLTVGLDRELPQLDEGLFFDVFHQSPPPQPAKPKSGRRRKR